MGKLAPLIGWTVLSTLSNFLIIVAVWKAYSRFGCGKGGVLTVAPIGKLFPNAGVKPEWTSKWTAFEAPDPIYWTKHGYAIIIADTPGTWYSDQKPTYLSPEETEQFYDLIEWAGKQDWSSGLVGLSGVSYLALMQVPHRRVYLI
jgi:predicted acyl esterase